MGIEYAIDLSTGHSVPLKSWMRFSPNHVFVVNGVSKLVLSDETWTQIKAAERF